MKKWTIFLLLALTQTAYSQTPERAAAQSAGALAISCAKVAVDDNTPVEGASAYCVFVLHSFLSGWRLGADRGVSVPFTQDLEVMNTTKGFEDAWQRIQKLRAAARCAPNAINLFDLARALIAFLQAHPERTNDPAGSGVAAAIQDAYCR
jgi:Rap1a immunity proteins